MFVDEMLFLREVPGGEVSYCIRMSLRVCVRALPSYRAIVISWREE